MIAAILKRLPSLLIIVIVFPLISCSSPFGNAPAKATNHMTAAKTTTLSELADDQVRTMVSLRLQNMATSPQAKEYVALIINKGRWYSGYIAEENDWEVGIDISGESYDLIKMASWFHFQDIDYFAKTHWAEGRTHWKIFTDGNIIETGSMVESDINQLNTTGILK
jgi:hypothetical protein